MPSPHAHRGALGLLLAALMLPLLSCSSDDDSPTTPEPTTLDASGNIGPDGGVISSADGRLRLTIPAGALAEEVEVVITEVAAKDIAATAEGLDVAYAFTMEPANLELAVPMTLEIQHDGDKDAELAGEVPLPMGLFGATNEDGTYRAFPAQQLTINVGALVWQQVLSLVLIPQDVVIGVPVADVDGTTTPTTVLGYGQDLPDQAVEGTQFNADVLLAFSQAMLLAGDVNLGPIALQNLVSVLAEGGLVNVVPEGGPGSLTRLHALLSYAAGVPGPATWNVALRMQFEIQAAIAFPSTDNLPLILGAWGVLVQYAPVSLAIIEAGGGSDLGPGLYLMSALAESLFPVRNLEGFPYNNTLVVGAGNGTTIYSLDASNPAQPIYTGFQALERVIWQAMVVGRGDKAADLGSIAMVQAGPTGASLTQWFPEDNAFGFTGFLEFQSSITDAQPLGGDALSGGFVYVAPLYNAVRILEYNPDSGFYDLGRQFNNFPDAPGSPFTAAVRPGAGAVVVTEGSPGRIYHHDLADLGAAAVAIGDAGNGPRRLRTAGDLAFVSNFDSDELTVLHWTAAGEVSIVGTVPVGDGPVGIDALVLDGGNVAVVSTGFNDHTSTVTVFDPAGAVISNTTTSLPAEALAPGHAAWLRGEELQYGVSCNESGHLVVIDPGLAGGGKAR